MRQNHQLALVDNNGGGGSPRSMRDEIAAIFEQVLGRSVVITDETDIVEDLGMDSLGVMNFVMAIEDFYDLSIPLDRVAQIQTVADLVRAVEDLKSGSAA
jgi:acyl carrier protein